MRPPGTSRRARGRIVGRGDFGFVDGIVPEDGTGGAVLSDEAIRALLEAEIVLAEMAGPPSLDAELGDGSSEAVAAFVKKLEAGFLGAADVRPLVARVHLRALASAWVLAHALDDTDEMRAALVLTLREGEALLAALDAPARWGGAGKGRGPQIARDLALLTAFTLLRRRYPDEPVTATRARLGGSGAAEDSGADRQIREAIARAKSWCGGSDEK